MKKILLALAPILVLFAVACIYYSPVFEGKVVDQHDIVQFRGASKEILDHRKAYDDEPLWTNSLFSGMPTYGITTIYKNVYISKIDRFFKFNIPRPASYLIISFLGFFLLLVSLGCSRWLSLIGSLAYGLSSYSFIIIQAGHNTKYMAMAYMALVVMGLIITYKGKYLWGGLLTTLAMGLELLQNHPQITYYLAFIVVFYAIWQFIEDYKHKMLKRFFTASSVLLLAAALGLGMNISNYFVLLEYKTESTRGHSELVDAQSISQDNQSSTKNYDLDYMTSWSYGIPETLTLLIPDLMGGANQRFPGIESNVYTTAIAKRVPANQAKQLANSLPMYWGKQPFTSGPVYFGALVCFLFVLGLFIVKGKMKWWIVSVTLFSLFLAWGHHMMWLAKLMIYYFPGYDSFRAPSMALVIAQFTFPLLAILALKEFFSSDDKKSLLKPLMYSLYITGGICAGIALFGGVFFDFVGVGDARMLQGGYPQWIIDALREDRKSMMQADAFRSLAFIILGCASLWLYAKNKLKLSYAILSLVLLVLVDMWSVDKRYLNDDNFVAKKQVTNPFSPTAADLAIHQDKDPYYRVFNTTVNAFNDNSTSYFHHSVGGYSAVKLQRYQDLISYHLSKGNSKVFNMLNTKYFIQKNEKGAPKAVKNPAALGNAWFVQKVIPVDNANAEIAALNTFNPKTDAIVDNRFIDQFKDFSYKKDPAARIQLKSYKANELVFDYSSGVEQMTVFSDIYYDKGWTLLIDGQEYPYFRSNYVLRTAMLPAGKHTITWQFMPKSYNVGGTISLIAFMLMIIGLIIGLIIDNKTMKRTINNYLKS